MAIDRPRGFTLLELTAALALTGLVLLGATRLLNQLTDSGDVVKQAGVTASERHNGLRLLRALVNNAGSGIDSAQRFVGSPLTAGFATLCDAPGGWLESCRVRLDVAAVGDSGTLSVARDGSTAAPLQLWSGAAMTLRYLEATNGDAIWQATWPPSFTAPIAIAVVSPRDTVILPIGAR